MSTDDVDGPGRWRPTKDGWSWVCVAQLVPITVAVLRWITKWVSKRLKRCKKWPWPLNWLCRFFWVTVLVVVGFVVILVTVFITVVVCGWKRTEEDPATTISRERESETSGTTSFGKLISEKLFRVLRGANEGR